MLASTNDRDLLYLARPPENPELLDWLTVGVDVWESFAIREYLDKYIANGGSQLKLIIGRPGSGKTHLLHRIQRAAHDRGYVVAAFSASSVRLQRIDDLYRAIVEHVDLEELTRRLAHRVIQEMGYNPEEVPADQTFADWAVEQGHMREVVSRDIESKLGRFFKQRQMETNLCLAYVQLAAAYLGVRQLAQEDRKVLYRWIRGERLKVVELRPLLISRSIDRYNARDMLDSLSRLARELGFKGLVVSIDGMEALTDRDPETGRWKYTKNALNDVYQSLREFVDSMPSLTSVFMVLAGRRELLDDLSRGILSYEALWLRLQHEVVVPERFNRFGQIIDLDKATELLLDDDQLRLLYDRVQEALGIDGAGDMPDDVLSPYGEVGRFRKVVQAARTAEQ